MKARAKRRRSSGATCSFKRRRFRGHKSFKNPNSQPCNSAADNVIDDNPVTSPASSSRRKLEGSCNIKNELPNEENPSHYLLMNSDIVTELINLIGCCPKCNSRELTFENDVSNKKGLFNCLCISCNKCQWSYSTYTSKSIEKASTPGVNAFNMNVRSAIAFCEIGEGHCHATLLWLHEYGTTNATDCLIFRTMLLKIIKLLLKYRWRNRQINWMKHRLNPCHAMLHGKNGDSSLWMASSPWYQSTLKSVWIIVSKQKSVLHVLYGKIEKKMMHIKTSSGSSGLMESQGLVEMFMSSVQFNGLRSPIMW